MKLIIMLLIAGCTSTPQVKEPLTVKPTKIVSLVNVISVTNFNESEKEKLAAYMPASASKTLC